MGSAVVGGIVGFAGLEAVTNSTGWAEFNVKKMIPDLAWGQVAYGVRDGEYGITFGVENRTLPVAKKNRFIVVIGKYTSETGIRS